LFPKNYRRRDTSIKTPFLFSGYPDLPEDIFISTITNTSAELRFNADFDNAQLKPEVTVYVQKERDSWSLKVLHKINTKGVQKTEIESLNPKTTYFVTLKICNIYGCNPQHTNPVIFVTRGTELYSLFNLTWLWTIE
jgi:hypothetical protein